jgi:ADP-ribose pyrophosphatase
MDSKRLSEKKVYRKEEYVKVVDRVEGRLIEKQFRRIKGPYTVTVLPLLDKDTVLLVRQYRPAMRGSGFSRSGFIYELPGGHVEKGESIVKAARRETEEEIGYTAKSVKFLYTGAITPWSSDAGNSVLVANGLTKSKKKLDEDELMETVQFKADEIEKRLKSGKIFDLTTRDGLLYWLMFLR